MNNKESIELLHHKAERALQLVLSSSYFETSQNTDDSTVKVKALPDIKIETDSPIGMFVGCAMFVVSIGGIFGGVIIGSIIGGIIGGEWGFHTGSYLGLFISIVISSVIIGEIDKNLKKKRIFIRLHSKKANILSSLKSSAQNYNLNNYNLNTLYKLRDDVNNELTSLVLVLENLLGKNGQIDNSIRGYSQELKEMSAEIENILIHTQKLSTQLMPIMGAVG